MTPSRERRRKMSHQESRKHHYVPEFLLKAWATDNVLNGYWWDAKSGRLARKQQGPKAFCKELDLLLLEQHPEGRDILENKFFGGIDTQGALAREQLLEGGPRSLTEDQRRDIARLLLSLEVRWPERIEQVRTESLRFRSSNQR